MRLTFNGVLDPKWSADQVAGIYNALDCAITLEVFDELNSQLSPEDRKVYDLSRSYQAPLLEMMLRGVRVDKHAMQMLAKHLQSEVDNLHAFLQEIGKALGLPIRKGTKALPVPHYINPSSPKQLKEFFYGFLKIPEVRVFNKQKGVSQASTSREALEKVATRSFLSRPIVATILAIRDRTKELGYLKLAEADGRMRFSFNIGGTETARLSSSKSVWGTGYNAQNIKPGTRHIFIADPGCKLAYVDLEQAESRLVGFLAPGNRYWDACHSGDLHTTCAKMVWPRLGWTGDAKQDRAIADTIFYREFSYRDLSKRGGHGTNYYGQPPTMAKHLHVETQLLIDFQAAYFQEFPEIREWHLETKERLQLDGYLITPWGRKRWFHGRRDDDATLREAIAYVPQSAIADYMNSGMREVWRRIPEVQLLLQVHDAIVFQYPEGRDDLVDKVVETLRIPLTYNGKTLIIPSEPKVGWNWGYPSAKNPDGMVKYKGPNSDKRTRSRLMDRVVC